jgi:hypothetical protein
MTTADRDDDAHLSPTEDLHVALNLIGSFQGTIQHADTKAGMLFAGQAVLTGTAATAPAQLSPQWAGLVFSAGFLLGLIGSLWHLAVAIRPRLSGPEGVNRFSLPHVAGLATRTVGLPVRQQCEHAWQLAATLAAIAIEKHQRIQRAFPWVGLTVLVFLARALLAGHL